MEVIGLYDLNLWHSTRKFPNLELMKIFNYYYKNNAKVVMMTPETDEGRFNKIIYFKETYVRESQKLPAMSGPNKQIFGYGFYKKSELLPEPIQATPPSFMPYDPYSNLLTSHNSYEALRRSSLVRLRTNDLTGMNDNNKRVFIVDIEPLQCENFLSFIRDNPKRNIYTFYGLNLQKPEDLDQYRPYLKQIKSQFFIPFKFTPHFFLENYKICNFQGTRYKEETLNSYYSRLIKMGFCCKQLGITLPCHKTETLPIVRSITQWIKLKDDTNFASFIKDEQFLNAAPTELRLLCKQKPSKVNCKELDFWSKL